MLFPIQVTYDSSHQKCRNGANDPLRTVPIMKIWSNRLDHIPVWSPGGENSSGTADAVQPRSILADQSRMCLRSCNLAHTNLSIKQRAQRLKSVGHFCLINYTDNGFYLKTILLSCTELVAPQNVHFNTVNFRLSGSTPALSKSVLLFQLYSLQL